MQFNVITIFPQMIQDALSVGVVGQAVTSGAVRLKCVTPRTFTEDFHRTVDDRPYGGGDGMVLLAKPLIKAVLSLGPDLGRVVYLSPHGKKWSDKMAKQWATELGETGSTVTLICGRYGGVDQRFINAFVDEEVSIGDFILSGGEIAALALMDSVIRLLPNVVGNVESIHKESFGEDGLLEAPLFSRPQELADQIVPQVFLSGDHQRIQKLRRALQLVVTRRRRPDLLQPRQLNELREACDNLRRELSREELLSCGLMPQDLST